MTTKILSNAVVIPQDPGTGIDTTDDAISAAGAALLASHEQGSYVRKSNNANSLSFANVDTSNNEVDVKAGVAYIVDVSGGTHNDRSTDGNPQLQSTSTSGFDTEIPNRQPYCVIIPNDQVDLSLDSGVNDVFLEVRARDQNDPILRFGSSVTTGSNALKLGTVDTSNGNITRANDKPSPKYNALETEQIDITPFKSGSATIPAGGSITPIDYDPTARGLVEVVWSITDNFGSGGPNPVRLRHSLVTPQEVNVEFIQDANNQDLEVTVELYDF